MERFLVILEKGGKKTAKEFPSLEDAWGFVPQALSLRIQAPDLKVFVRIAYSSTEIVEPHWGEPKRDGKGEIMYSPFTSYPFRNLRKFPTQKGKWYCPVCGYHTEFKHDSYYGIKKCSCGMSANDFYVKSVNGLWKTG